MIPLKLGFHNFFLLQLPPLSLKTLIWTPHKGRKFFLALWIVFWRWFLWLPAAFVRLFNCSSISDADHTGSSFFRRQCFVFPVLLHLFPDYTGTSQLVVQPFGSAWTLSSPATALATVRRNCESNICLFLVVLLIDGCLVIWLH